MVRYLSCVLALGMLSCTSESLSSLREEELIVTAVFRAGEVSQSVSVTALDPATGRAIPAAGELRVFNGTSWTIYVQEDNSYVSPADAEPMPFETEGKMIFEREGNVVEGVFITPEALSPGFVTPLEFAVETSLPEQVVFSSSWNALPGYEYIARLSCLEDAPVAIPFSGQAGLFEARNQGPFLAPELAIRSNDFRYYGTHLLQVVAVDALYRDAHFFNPVTLSGDLLSFPSNLTGGKGFATATSSFSLQLEILP
jgi:hypothetical protein